MRCRLRRVVRTGRTDVSNAAEMPVHCAMPGAVEVEHWRQNVVSNALEDAFAHSLALERLLQESQ